MCCRARVSLNTLGHCVIWHGGSSAYAGSVLGERVVMLMNGVHILAECLNIESVTRVFGTAGCSAADLYGDPVKNARFHFLSLHSERDAVYAADAYARATGEAGVCIVPAGSGAVGTVSGIVTSYADSVPMVIICDQVRTSLIGNDAFQYADVVGITRPCTKHNYIVKDVTKLAWIVREAFFIARTGRPGPVLIDLPLDVQQAETEFIAPEVITLRSYNPSGKANLNQLRACLDVLKQSERPLMLLGGGTVSADAAESVTQIAETMGIPVVGSLMALGAFPADNPLWLGMVGKCGSPVANAAVEECDALLAMGTRFDDRITSYSDRFAPNAKIIHVDIDPTSIKKNVNVDVPIVADCRCAAEGLKNLTGTEPYNFPWKQRFSPWVRHLSAKKGKSEALFPTGWLEENRENRIIVTDAGTIQMRIASLCPMDKPRTFIGPGGMGTVGYALPAAVGVQWAYPDKTVICVLNEASLLRSGSALMTVAEHALPVKIVVMADAAGDAVRHDTKHPDAADGTKYPDWILWAKAYGVDGYKVTESKTPKRVFASKKPVLLDMTRA